LPNSACFTGLRRTSTHLPNSACFMLTSRTLTCRHPLTLLSRSCPDPNRRTSGSAISPTAYRILCVRLPCNSLCSRGTKLRSRTNTRYGRVASPYPTGTFTRQEAPSFARRDNVKAGPPPVAAPVTKRRRGNRRSGRGACWAILWPGELMVVCPHFFSPFFLPQGHLTDPRSSFIFTTPVLLDAYRVKFPIRFMISPIEVRKKTL
jgi:hypothetical protein